MAELDARTARLLLQPWRQPLPRDQFARVWRGEEHLGRVRAGEVLEAVNGYRRDAGRDAAPVDHIVPYDGCVLLQGNDRNRVAGFFDAIRAGSDTAWSDEMLKAVLKNQNLVALAVAQSIALAARAAGLNAVPVSVPHNNNGKPVPKTLKWENDAYLIAHGLSGFAY